MALARLSCGCGFGRRSQGVDQLPASSTLEEVANEAEARLESGFIDVIRRWLLSATACDFPAHAAIREHHHPSRIRRRPRNGETV
jgi:hypothetical protein